MINEHKENNNNQKNTINEQTMKTKLIRKCVTCNKTYKYHHWLEHMRTVHGNVHLICDHCNKSFKCEKYLHRHIRNRHLRKAELKTFQEFTREQCQKNFKSGDKLNKHVKNCHSEKVTCQICNSVLKSPVYLSSHMRRVHCDSSKKCKCGICGKQFKSARQVRIHVGNTHDKKLCPKCGQMYTATALSYHFKSCGINIQNAKAKIADDDLNVDVVVDDNDHVDIDYSQVNENSRGYDDVKIDDQLNIKNISNFKKDINENNDSQINGNSNVHNDVKVEIHDHVNDQLNIENIKIDINKSDNCQINKNSDVHEDVKVDIQGHVMVNRDINDDDSIYYNDMEDIDVGDNEVKREDFHDRANQIRISFYHYDHKLNGITVDDHNENGATIQGVISNNGDCNVQTNNRDMVGHFCRVCNKKLKSEERVKIHMKNAHSKNLPVKCQHCGKFFFNLKYFNVHIRKCRT